MAEGVSAPKEETIQSSGGATIFLRSWQQAAPRGIVVICHGVNSHGGQYIWPAEQFAARGFSVYALDLRGRGKSSGERFYVEDVADYASDVAATVRLAKSREPGVPVFLLGHSAGGLTSCIYTLDNQKELAGFICESFAFRVPAPAFALVIIRLLGRFFPHLPVLKLKNKDFSRDPKAVAALNADPLIAGEVQPARTVAALLKGSDRLERSFPQITLPVFILHGTADKATVPAGSVFFHKTAGSKDKTLKLYEGHFHDLLNDYGKEGVIADMAEWIEKRLGSR